MPKALPVRSMTTYEALPALGIGNVGGHASVRRSASRQDPTDPDERHAIGTAIARSAGPSRAQLQLADDGSGGTGAGGRAAAVWPSITAGGIAASWIAFNCAVTAGDNGCVVVSGAQGKVDRVRDPVVQHQLGARLDQQQGPRCGGAGLAVADLGGAHQILRRVQRIVGRHRGWT